jgi:hypothetical protein
VFVRKPNFVAPTDKLVLRLCGWQQYRKSGRRSEGDSEFLTFFFFSDQVPLLCFGTPEKLLFIKSSLDQSWENTNIRWGSSTKMLLPQHLADLSSHIQVFQSGWRRMLDLAWCWIDGKQADNSIWALELHWRGYTCEFEKSSDVLIVFCDPDLG